MNSFSWTLYKILVSILTLASFYFWPLWHFPGNPYFWLASFAILLVVRITNSNLKGSEMFMGWGFVLLMALIAMAKNVNFYGVLSVLFPGFIAIDVMVLTPERKNDLLEALAKTYALIFAISLCAWIPSLFGFELPYNMVPFGTKDDGEDLYYFENHYLYLKNTTMLLDLAVPRFCSVFLEPGYAGCLCSVFLLIGKYDLKKWENVVFLITLLFTLSLAACVITLTCFFLSKIMDRKHAFRFVLIYILVVGGAFLFFQNLNDGNNVITMAINERMRFDKNSGTIAGYNRITDGTRDWFWATFISSDKVITGDENAEANLTTGDIDWKSYIVRYGLIGLSLLVIFFLYPVVRYRNWHNKQLFVLFIAYMLVFAQTSHSIMWLLYVTLYILGINKIINDSPIENLNNEEIQN